MKILTITFTTHAFGAHMRHEEMVKGLIHEGHEVIWLTPCVSTQLPPGVKKLSFTGKWMLSSFQGKIFSTLLTLIRYNKEISGAEVAFSITELQACALVLGCKFLHISNIPKKQIFFSRMDPVKVASFHSKIEVSLLRWLKWKIREKLFSAFQQWLFRYLDKIVVQAPFLAKDLVSKYPYCNSKIIILPNSTSASWMNTRQIDIRNVFQIQQQKIISFVGNLYWEGKGLWLIPEIAAYCVDESIAFVVIGNGPSRHLLEKEIYKRNLKNVFILGAINNASKYMQSFDIFLATSQFDSCPNTVIEAINHGTAVIATDIPAHKFLLGNDYKGLCTTDGKKMSDIIKKYLNNPGFHSIINCQLKNAKQKLDFDWIKEIERIVTK